MKRPIGTRKRRANSNQFDWTLGKRRKLAMLLNTGLLSYTELGRVFGVSKNAIASAVLRYGLKLTPEEVRERRRLAGETRTVHGRRGGSLWDEHRLTERWADRRERHAREKQRAAAAGQRS